MEYNVRGLTNNRTCFCAAVGNSGELARFVSRDCIISNFMSDGRWDSDFSVVAVGVLLSQCLICQERLKKRNLLRLFLNILGKPRYFGKSRDWL
jgi:hypothetical protein